MARKTLFLTLVLIGIPILSHAGEWTVLRPGLSYRTLETAEPLRQGKSQSLHLFRIDPKKFHLRPIVATTGTTLSAADARRSTSALLAINANFFDEAGNILGLVLRDGKTFSPLRKISWWGVFFLKGSTAGIVHSSSFVRDPQIVNAIEAGPRLVIDGAIPKLKSGFSRKSAVGINRRGEVVIAVSPSPIETTRFATILHVRKERGGRDVCRPSISTAAVRRNSQPLAAPSR